MVSKHNMLTLLGASLTLLLSLGPLRGAQGLMVTPAGGVPMAPLSEIGSFVKRTGDGYFIEFPMNYTKCAVSSDFPYSAPPKYRIENMVYFDSVCFEFTKGNGQFAVNISEGKGAAITEEDFALLSKVTVLPEHFTYDQMAQTAQSLLPSLQLAAEYPAIVDKIYLRSAMVQQGFVAATLRGLFALYPKSSLTLFDVLPDNKRTCMKNVVLVGGSTCILQDSLADLHRRLFLAGCGINPADPIPAPTADVVILRRRAYEGNMRMLVNEVEFVEAFDDRGLVAQNAIIPRSFCDQIRLVHKRWKAVISVHGAHLMLLNVLGSGAFIIEVNSRHMHTAVFCHLYRNINGTGVIFATDKEGQGKLYSWCEPKNFDVYWDGKCPSSGRCQWAWNNGLPENYVYLNYQEVQMIAKAANLAIRSSRRQQRT